MKRLLLIGVVAGIVVTSISSCTIYRGIVHGAPKINSHKLFTNDTIRATDNAWLFKKGSSEKLDTTNWKYSRKGKTIASCPIDSLFTYSKTTALVIIRNDSVLLERYYKGRKREDVSTVYSVSKTLTCLLAEIAIDEGVISSIDDPVRKYFPEVGNKRDTTFNSLTIRHLMDMRAMIKHPETYNVDPFSKLARLFYGRNAMGQLKKLRLDTIPGSKSNYQSVATEILGIVIERATGKSLAQYMQEKVWKTLGMEYNALLSLDSKKHRNPKAFGGFAVTAIDLAKIGRLYLNNGNWNGKQIIDSSWVKNIITPRLENYGYQLSWRTWRPAIYTDSAENKWHFHDSISAINRAKELGKDMSLIQAIRDDSKQYKGQWFAFDYTSLDYYALGIMEQVMYIDPKQKLILIRLGHKDDFIDYIYLLNKISKRLQGW